MQLIKRSNWLWEIPQTGDIRVPGRIYASARMVDDMRGEASIEEARAII